MTALELAAILRVNAVDADKELSLAQCVERFERTPEMFRQTWLRKAEKYLQETSQKP